MILMFVILGVVALIQCSGQFHQTELKVVECTLVSEQDMPVLIGKAVNDGNFTVNNPRAEVKWFNVKGEVIDTTIQRSSSSVEGGGVWNFVVKGYGVSAVEVSRYELKVYY